MAGYESNFWDVQQNTNFPDQSQSFEFQSFDQNQPINYSSQIYTPDNNFVPSASFDYQSNDDEPPLLEELEINPERIIKKSLAVLNPIFSKTLANEPEYLLAEADLAGPILFCLSLAACLFLSGNKAHFGYIYGLSIITVLVMYTLISLMSNAMVSLTKISGVASILGYSILPEVILAFLGIFISLKNTTGLILAIVSVILSTTAASKMFCVMTGDADQKYLIAYPCALVYIIFALLVLF